MQKKFCALLYHAQNYPFDGNKLRIIVHENDFVAILYLKRNEVRVYISLKVNKLTCFVNSLGSFQVHDLVHDF